MTKFFQLETDFRTVNCGMSYVFQLEDGRFVILDGGYFADGQAEALHDFLLAHANGKIRVAAWLFSHAHQDHIGAFINYIRMYRDTEIEELVYNFQPADFSNISADWKGKDDYATFHEFYVAVDECLPGIKTLHPKRGESFRAGEAEFAVLYTYEDAREPITNFNDNSTVFMANVCGVRILLPGDAATLGSQVLLEKPEALACDMVQVAHHGFHGAAKEVYEAAGAKVILWPAPRYEMANNASRPANDYLLHCGAEIVLANDGTACFTLPEITKYDLEPRIFPDKV